MLKNDATGKFVVLCGVICSGSVLHQYITKSCIHLKGTAEVCGGDATFILPFCLFVFLAPIYMVFFRTEKVSSLEKEDSKNENQKF